MLEARGLDAGARGVDFVLRQGEILGVAGLQGMGQQDLFNACFGMTPPRAGQILVDGREVALGSPADAIRPNIGIGMVPEDRKTEGLFLKLDGRANATAVAARFALRRAEPRAEAPPWRAPSRRCRWTGARTGRRPARSRAAISRRSPSPNGWWRKSRILLLFDPTRGIDVGKHELYLLMRRYVEAGGAILFHSTEIPEIVHLCDRALVLTAAACRPSWRARRDRGGHHARRAGRIRARQERRMNTDLTGSAPMLRRVSQDRRAGAGWSRHRGLVTAIAVFALLLATVAALGNGGLSYFDLSFLASGGAGDRHGRDAGDPDRRLRPVGRRVISLVNGAGAGVAGGIGLAAGADGGRHRHRHGGRFNGFFVAVLRLQPSW